VGVALETAGEHGEPLLRNADLAMYAAKGRGKGRYELYEPTMRTDTLKRLELRSGLEDALEREELALVYQPIVDLSREETVAVEALLRWRHRERGLLGPAEFIPLAEETGLIVPIGRWVLREACRQAQRWARRRAGRVPLGVAVNISPRQLEDPALVDHVTEALADSGLIPSALTLEITEGVFVGQGIFSWSGCTRSSALESRSRSTTSVRGSHRSATSPACRSTCSSWIGRSPPGSVERNGMG